MKYVLLILAIHYSQACLLNFKRDPLKAPIKRANALLEKNLSIYHKAFASEHLEQLKNVPAYWQQVREIIEKELKEINAFKKQYQKEEIAKRVDEVGNKMVARYGELGFHYNLNGGSLIDYVSAGGLMTSRGDIALQYGAKGNLNQQVYFFRSSQVSLSKIFGATNPKYLYGKQRMGHVLNIFRLDHTYFDQAKKTGTIIQDEYIYFSYNEAKLAKLNKSLGYGPRIGVPYSTYVLPPLIVFSDFKHFLGKRYTWDEQNLIMARYLEVVLDL
jgi:hypothetical protein